MNPWGHTLHPYRGAPPRHSADLHTAFFPHGRRRGKCGKSPGAGGIMRRGQPHDRGRGRTPTPDTGRGVEILTGGTRTSLNLHAMFYPRKPGRVRGGINGVISHALRCTVSRPGPGMHKTRTPCFLNNRGMHKTGAADCGAFIVRFQSLPR